MKKSLHSLIVGLSVVLLSPSLTKAQIYVKVGGTGDGSSWATATGDLQVAIDAANLAYAGDPNALPNPIPGDGIIKQIWVAAGTYEALAVANFFQHKPVPYSQGFVMKNGVEIYGGFNGTETALSQRNWKNNVTILTGGGTHRVVTNYYTSDAGRLTETAVLDGFTITNGKGVGDEKETASGGGIYNNFASPTLRNLVITGNQSGSNKDNAAFAWDGGGILNDNASGPTIINCTISNNIATKSGGGMATQNASDGVSAIRTPKLFNVLISGNTAHRWGGGIFNFNLGTGTVVLTNVTITGNAATGQNLGNGGGGGASFSGNDANTKVRMNNCIVWGNTGKSGMQPNIHNQSGGVHNFYNSLVQGSGGSGAWISSFGTNSGGNIDVNPQFVGAPDYSLQSTSPAINAGSDALYAGLDANTKDLAGNPRKYSTTNIDMGAYEYQGTLPVTLIGFTAKADGNHAKLQWQTASEINNQGFVIYRSGDDKQFVKIGEVSSQTPNASHQTLYTFTDNSPLNGNNYYKLVQVDKDGTATELDVRTVNFQLSTLHFQLFPNPTADQLNVVFEAGKYSQLQLVNTNGKVLQNVAINNTENSKTLTIAAYPAGIYLVKLNGTTQTKIKKIVKK